MSDTATASADGPRLGLLGGFSLALLGRSVPLPDKTRRLVALVALRGPMPRVIAAAHFWPDHQTNEALALLRTVIWRANSGPARLLVADDGRLSLAAGVFVDVAELRRQAAAVAAAAVLDDPAPAPQLEATLLSDGELLPEWDDPWVLEERQHLRQLQVHALESLALTLLRANRYGQALDLAIRAVRMEPMRESAQRAVIEVHLAERNVVEAVRQYSRFRQLLLSEIGVGPSRALASLVMSASAASV